MHRLTALLLTGSLITALPACGGGEDPAPSGGGAAGTGGAAPGGSGGSAGASGSAGSGGGTGGGTAPDPTVPATLNQADWDAFMTNQAYTMNGWVSDVAAPRPGGQIGHGTVRVFFNPTLLASIAAGNGASVTSTPHTVNSMAVKELYDDANMLVGHLAFLKVDEGGGGEAWQYYCRGPAERCYTNSPDFTATPMFAKGDSNCGGCHAGVVFTMPPQ